MTDWNVGPTVWLKSWSQSQAGFFDTPPVTVNHATRPWYCPPASRLSFQWTLNRLQSAANNVHGDA